MPNVKDLPAYYGTIGECDDGGQFGVLFLVENDAGFSRVFFRPDGSERASTPIVVVWTNDEDFVVFVDLDRDGKIDREGAPGNPGIGKALCDIIHDFK